MDFFNTWVEKGIIERLSVLSLTYNSLHFLVVFFESILIKQLICRVCYFSFSKFCMQLQSDFCFISNGCQLFCTAEQDVVEKEFVQLSYSNAIEILLKAKTKFEFPVIQFSLFWQLGPQHMIMNSHVFLYTTFVAFALDIKLT